jgi:hypothetical protein
MKSIEGSIVTVLPLSHAEPTSQQKAQEKQKARYRGE